MPGLSEPCHLEAPIRTLVVSLLGVAAVTAGVLLCRQQKLFTAPGLKEVPAGESMPATISLERLRELGY
jgi:hypothetical protein